MQNIIAKLEYELNIAQDKLVQAKNDISKYRNNL